MPGRLALVGGDGLPDSSDLRSVLIEDGSPLVHLSVGSGGDSSSVEEITTAGAIAIHGTGAADIARRLRGSQTWTAIEQRWRGGATLIAFGEAAVAICGYIPDLRNPTGGGAAGLGVIPSLRVLPYFDVRSRLIPDSALAPLVAPGTTVVGIDEGTALVAEAPLDGDLWDFRSRGLGSAWRIESDRRYRVNAPMRLRVSS